MKLFLTGNDEVAAVLGFQEARAGVRASEVKVKRGRGSGIYKGSEKTVCPRKSDERAPGPSHSLDMCHPRTKRWRSCEIVGE